jgi:hypothetical protein
MNRRHQESSMQARTQPYAEYTLSSDTPLRLEDAGGRVLEAVAGVTWITAYGQATDFLLRPGQRFVVPNDGLTLVDAIGSSRIRLAAPLAQSWGQRVLREGQARLAESMMRLRQGLQPPG